MIAALYVETGGCYVGLPGVDPWDEARKIGVVAMVGGKDKTRIRNATPKPFRDLLISIAGTAHKAITA
jgi:hypothetical protein